MNIYQKQAQINLRQRPLIFLDLETTGLNVQEHEIVEIGAVKTQSKKPFKIIEKLEIRVKAKHLEKADPKALKVLEYSDLAWSDAVDLSEALRKLDEFAEGGVLIGFNINFDWACLDKAYHYLGRIDPFYYQRIDVMSMAYQKFYTKRSLKRFSLHELCKYLNIKMTEHHHALADAMTTYQLFKALVY